VPFAGRGGSNPPSDTTLQELPTLGEALELGRSRAASSTPLARAEALLSSRRISSCSSSSPATRRTPRSTAWTSPTAERDGWEQPSPRCRHRCRGRPSRPYRIVATRRSQPAAPGRTARRLPGGVEHVPCGEDRSSFSVNECSPTPCLLSASANRIRSPRFLARRHSALRGPRRFAYPGTGRTP
jgi:hypothetical protein